MDSNPPESPSTPLKPPLESASELLASLLTRVNDLERQVALLQDAVHSGDLPQDDLIQDALIQDALIQDALIQDDPLERELPAATRPRLSRAAAPPPPPRPLPAPLQRLIEDDEDDRSIAPVKPAQSLENRLGSQVFNRIGIVALLFATSWALKLAIEQGWLGPVARILIGLGLGVGLVLWSERFRRKGFPPFSYSLKAVGTGVLYLTLWAAFHLYDLLPASAALGAMILVSAWNAFMAWSQDSELLAAYALTGAFLTPVLLSTGGDHEIFLFTYIAAIDLCTLALVRWKPWPKLLLATLAGTISFYIGWYASFYPQNNTATPHPQPAQPFALTVAFTLLFFVLFLLPSIKHFLSWPDALLETEVQPIPRRFPLILDVLIPLGNAAFASLALYSLFQDSLRHDLLPWLMVAFAAAYLALTRLQRRALSSAVHLALAIIFLTIAIPLKASGHTLTIAWLVEGLALLWTSTRIPKPAADSESTVPELLTPSSVLRFLSFAGYTLGFLALFVSRFWFDDTIFPQPTFVNANLASGLIGIAVFTGAAYLGLQAALFAPNPPIAWLPVAWSDFLAIDAVALLLTFREIVLSTWSRGQSSTQHPAFTNPDFFTALIGLATLAATTYTLARLIRIPALTGLTYLAALTFILFNLATILTIERELSALWTRSDANLQRSLAISGFLMLYGAALLTLGFLKRNAFTRWQALILLLFTVAKVFLYDMSTLSQGYRVASVLGLGVVLMAVSFAYQKDWLALKSPEPTEPTAPDHA